MPGSETQGVRQEIKVFVAKEFAVCKVEGIINKCTEGGVKCSEEKGPGGAKEDLS